MKSRFALGLQHALIILAIQFAGIRVLDFVAAGTRAQAVGACVATLSFLFSGVALGLRFRKKHLPIAAANTASLMVAVVGVIGFETQVLAPLLPAGSIDTGGMARAIFATDAILLPGVALVLMGIVIGENAEPRAVRTGFGGFALFAGLAVSFVRLARYTSYDEAVVQAYGAGGLVLAALLTGFFVAWFRRSLAFVELWLIALLAGYTGYFLISVGPSDFIAASNIPEQQILVAFALAPTIGLMALLTVGGSLGFILHGGGRFDPGFRYEVSVALRYLRAHRRDRFIGKVTVISVAGVSLGVMALIVVLSVMSGFEDDLKRKILGAHAHIVISKTGDDFFEYAEVEARAREVQGVATAAAYVLGDAMASSDVGLSGTLVKGIDPNERRASGDLRQNIEKGNLEDLLHPERIVGARSKYRFQKSDGTTTSSLTGTSTVMAEPIDLAIPIMREPAEMGGKVLPGIIIGRELSKALRTYVGDVVRLVSPVSEEIGPTGPHPKLRRFRVAGIFYSGMYEYDAKFTYVDMKQAQRFFGLHKRASGIEIKVTDTDDTARIVQELELRLGGAPYVIKDWRTMNKELFSALLLEKLAMFIILAFIVLVASFNILATLVMIVLEKGKEIAILKSIGASDASIMKVFVVQGLIVGMGGALLGLTGGLSICLLIARYGIQLDQRIFYIERLPVVMSGPEITAIAIAAVLISYLATIYPAITAARLRPVEGLRDDY